MGRVAVAASSLGALLAGCAQLFGLQQTTGGTSTDAPGMPSGVSLTFQRISVGATVVRAPLDLTGQTASYLIVDSTTASGLRAVPGMLAASNDTWTAPIPDGTPPVEYTLPDYPTSFRRIYSFSQRNLQGLFGALEHPNPDPAPVGGAFSVKVTLPSPYTAGEAFQLEAVGPWGVHGFAAGELPPLGGVQIGPVAIPFSAAAFGSQSGRPLTKVTTADQLVVLRYVGNHLTGAGEFAPFTQSGATDSLTATMTAPAQVGLDVHVQPSTVGSRLNQTLPAATAGSLSMAWSVVAAPGYQIANNTGPLLQYGTVLPADSGAITAPYGNPFTAHGWNSVFTWATSVSRTYTPPAKNLPMTLVAGLNELAEPSPALLLDLPAGLPQVVQINQMSLSSDGMTVVLDPTKSVELALTADKASNTFYQFNIYELVPNLPMNPTALTYSIVAAALSDVPKVTLPNDIFVGGHIYTVRAHCVQGGYPTFAQGNLQNRNLPYAVGYLDSGVFTVTNP